MGKALGDAAVRCAGLVVSTFALSLVFSLDLVLVGPLLFRRLFRRSWVCRPFARLTTPNSLL